MFSLITHWWQNLALTGGRTWPALTRRDLLSLFLSLMCLFFSPQNCGGCIWWGRVCQPTKRIHGAAPDDFCANGTSQGRRFTGPLQGLLSLAHPVAPPAADMKPPASWGKLAPLSHKLAIRAVVKTQRRLCRMGSRESSRCYSREAAWVRGEGLAFQGLSPFSAPVCQ